MGDDGRDLYGQPIPEWILKEVFAPWNHDYDYIFGVRQAAAADASLYPPSPRNTDRPVRPEVRCPGLGGQDVVRRVRQGLVQIEYQGRCRTSTCGYCGPAKAFATVKAVALAPLVEHVFLRPTTRSREASNDEARAFRSTVRRVASLMLDQGASGVGWTIQPDDERAYVAHLVTRGEAVPPAWWMRNSGVFGWSVKETGGIDGTVEEEARWMLFVPLSAFQASTDDIAAADIRDHLLLNGGRIMTTVGKFWRSGDRILRNVAEARALALRKAFPRDDLEY